MSGIVGLTGTYNGIAGNQHVLRTKLVHYSRTSSEGSGTETLTGAGFEPVGCFFQGGNPYNGAGMGYASVKENGTIIQGTATHYGGNGGSDTPGRADNEQMYRQSAGNSQTWQCSMSAFTTDGATVAFNGNDADTLTYSILWYR
jgi:hypothetical protein